MYVEIDDRTKNWIETRGTHLTVKILDVDACCAPNVEEVVAVPGKPKSFDHFNPIKVDNLTIYIQKNLCSKERLVLKLSGIGFLKTISAKIQ